MGETVRSMAYNHSTEETHLPSIASLILVATATMVTVAGLIRAAYQFQCEGDVWGTICTSAESMPVVAVYITFTGILVAYCALMVYYCIRE